MTSNIGSQIIREQAEIEGQTMGDVVEEMISMTPEEGAKRMAELAAKMQDALSSTFRPEFLNRIDNVITFKELSIDGIEPIAKLQIAEVQERLNDRNITLEVTPAALDSISIDGFDPIYGARPLKRLIQRVIVDKVAQRIVDGQLLDGSTVTIDVGTDDYVVSVKS